MPTSVKGVCANHVPQVAKFFPVRNSSTIIILLSFLCVHFVEGTCYN